ncbi:MAG TPA: ABC transporter substrate-binding protein [Bacteroidales bacterium]|jgi:NitT/TauT family transport system substrate-binding protein|nr:ABC transporter substrate-binding protein [Bacteroidales bacterium]HOS71418.1 ABC transporter substrate-binding protein [Bacteroidales bacterium]HQH23703.1 ABC transporter substrate-binding protein [Bacteroidales bacterium]HQJ82292.1 ABC transporter substrate-binding protein [Bacteroidales bacterium]
MRSNLFILIFILLVCSACGGHGKRSHERKFLTIASLKGPSSMGIIRFIDSVYNDSAKNIKISIQDEPIQVRKMILDGSADFALLPSNMAAILYNMGFDYRLAAIPVWGTLYLFGGDTSVKSWEDLRNKRVYAMARGMTPDVLFRFLLEKNGLDPDRDIILDYSFPTHLNLSNAVAAGKADLAVLSEPQVSLVMKRNKNVHRIFDLNSEWNKVQGFPIAQTAFIVREDLLRNDPGLAERIISACERSVRWVNSYPDSAAVLIVKYNILPDAEVAVSAIPGSNMNFVRARGIREEIEKYFAVFYKMNPDIIGRKMPDENFYY